MKIIAVSFIGIALIALSAAFGATVLTDFPLLASGPATVAFATSYIYLLEGLIPTFFIYIAAFFSTGFILDWLARLNPPPQVTFGPISASLLAGLILGCGILLSWHEAYRSSQRPYGMRSLIRSAMRPMMRAHDASAQAIRPAEGNSENPGKSRRAHRRAEIYFGSGLVLTLMAFGIVNLRPGRYVLGTAILAAVLVGAMLLGLRFRQTLYSVWNEAHPFELQLGQYMSSRGATILLVTGTYLYVILTMACVYHYIDTCDRRFAICDLVSYQNFLPAPPTRPADTSADSENCWSFHAIAPPSVLYGAPANTCTNHAASHLFRISGFVPYLYFAVVTSTTVGYGDIYPLSMTAAWIVMFHHLISIILLVGIVGQFAGFQFRE